MIPSSNGYTGRQWISDKILLNSYVQGGMKHIANPVSSSEQQNQAHMHLMIGCIFPASMTSPFMLKIRHQH